MGLREFIDQYIGNWKVNESRIILEMTKARKHLMQYQGRVKESEGRIATMEKDFAELITKEKAHLAAITIDYQAYSADVKYAMDKIKDAQPKKVDPPPAPVVAAAPAVVKELPKVVEKPKAPTPKPLPKKLAKM